MVYYIKVTPEVAKKFANIKLRNALKDGNVALWMSDLNMVPGDTLADRAEFVGGALLTPKQCADEYFGRTSCPASCYTPEYYGGASKDDETEGVPSDTPSEGSDIDSPSDGTTESPSESPTEEQIPEDGGDDGASENDSENNNSKGEEE